MDEKEAYKRGQDYAKKGANTHNCHFSVFVTQELTDAWINGKNNILKQTGDSKRQK